MSGYALAHRLNKTREGRAAGAREENLMAYTAAGTTSCHEATTLGEALERLRLGLAVMIREGFVRREFRAVAPIVRQGVDLHRVMLVSDLFDPADLVQGRGMNTLLARAVELGVDPLVAVQMVTRNVADYYGLRDLGGVAPGKIADLVLVEDLRDFECRRVWVGGRLAVDQGRPLLSPDPFVYPARGPPIFFPSRIEPGILALPAAHPETTVRVVKAVGPTITRESAVRLKSQKGFLEADLRQDVLKMAVFQRFAALPRPALGFAQGIGLKKGAVATSLGWDANNLLVIGVSDREMALAVNRLLDLAGGWVVAAGEQVLAEMPLPIMGLISEEPLPALQRQIEDLEQAFRTLGSDLERPFLTLQTFCFTGLPFIRLTDKGLADIRGKKLVNLFVELIMKNISGANGKEISVTGSLDWENIILGLKRTTKDFLETVVDNLSESIIVTDLDGKIVYFNKGSEKIFGYKPEEILGKHIMTLGVKRPNVLAEIRKGKTFRGELVHTRKDGQRRPTFVICIPLKDEQERPIAMVGSARDLTEEKEINRLRAFNEKVVTSLNDGIQIIDRNGTITFINHRFEEIIGAAERGDHRQALSQFCGQRRS